MQTFRSIARIGFLFCVYMIAPAGLVAQSGDTDTGEVLAFTGGAFGIGSHPVVGASAGAAISRYAIVLVETSFVPLGSYTVETFPAATTVQSSHLYDFNLSTNIRVPVRDRWAPYAILGVGAIWNTYTRSITGPLGIARVSDYGQFDFAFHTGAGLRYYIGKNWGIRPEVKVVVSTKTYTEMTVGIFAVMPTDWP